MDIVDCLFGVMDGFVDFVVSCGVFGGVDWLVGSIEWCCNVIDIDFVLDIVGFGGLCWCGVGGWLC